MVKNSKQQNLLKDQKKATSAKMSANSSLASLKSFTNSQQKETITYTDQNDHQQSKKITLTDPGIDKVSQMLTMSDRGDAQDMIQLYGMIMKNVIVNPKMSLENEAKKFPNSLKTKVISTTRNKLHEKVALKNKSGQKVQLNLKWPGYYVALQIIFSSIHPDGTVDMHSALPLLNSYVFKDADGRSVNNNYWNMGGHCSGLGIFAILNGIGYLTEALNYDGFTSAIQKAISFLSQSL